MFVVSESNVQFGHALSEYLQKVHGVVVYTCYNYLKGIV